MIRVIGWIKEKDIHAYNLKYHELYTPFGTYIDNEKARQYYSYGNEMTDNFLNEEYEYIEDALIKEIVENGYIICGDTHQELAIPVFENGCLILSMRKWNEIMKKAWSLQYKHIEVPNFYMKAVCELDEVLPQCVSLN